MVILENNEMEFATKHLQVVEQIVKTSSCSSIPTDFREGLLDMAIKYKWSNCRCNSAIYIATCRLYDNYLYTKQNSKDVKKESIHSRRNKGNNSK